METVVLKPQILTPEITNNKYGSVSKGSKLASQ